MCWTEYQEHLLQQQGRPEDQGGAKNPTRQGAPRAPMPWEGGCRRQWGRPPLSLAAASPSCSSLREASYASSFLHPHFRKLRLNITTLALMSQLRAEGGGLLHSTWENHGGISLIYEGGASLACSFGFKRAIFKIQLGCGECGRFGQVDNRNYRKRKICMCACVCAHACTQTRPRNLFIHFYDHRDKQTHGPNGENPLESPHYTYTTVSCLPPPPHPSKSYSKPLKHYSFR